MLNENLNHLLFTMMKVNEKVKEEYDDFMLDLEEGGDATTEELEVSELLNSLHSIIRDSRENIRNKCVEYLNAKEELDED